MKLKDISKCYLCTIDVLTRSFLQVSVHNINTGVIYFVFNNLKQKRNNMDMRVYSFIVISTSWILLTSYVSLSMSTGVIDMASCRSRCLTKVCKLIINIQIEI